MRDAQGFNNVETRAVIRVLFSLQDKTPKEIHNILTGTLDCFLPGRAKDLSAPFTSFLIRIIDAYNDFKFLPFIAFSISSS